MQDLNDLYYFAQVVEYQGFAAAGRALGIPKSKLSRRVAMLEEHLGVRLLNRSSRSFSLTDIGRAYYERARAVLVEAEAAEEFIARNRTEPRGLVRVACPVALLQYQFAPLFADFMKHCPAVELEIDSTNRRVDVVQEGFDIAIRVRFPPLEPSDLVMRHLDESPQMLVAAPSLFLNLPQSPADLADLPSLDHKRSDGRHLWMLSEASGQKAHITHKPRLITDDMAMLREAALAGVGLVQLPQFMVWDDLEAGRLLPILPEWQPPAGIIHAILPSRRGLLPAVRALLDFLANGCAQQRRQREAA